MRLVVIAVTAVVIDVGGILVVAAASRITVVARDPATTTDLRRALDGFSTEVVVTSPYGIAATSVVPSSMREPFGPSEPPAIDGGGEPSGSEPCTSGIAGAVCTIDRTLAAGVCTSDGRVSQRVDTARRALAQALEQGGSRRIMRFAARRLRQAARVAGRRGDTACAATLDALRGAL